MGVDPQREPAVTSLLPVGSTLPVAPTPWKKAVPLTDEQRAQDAALTKAATDAAIAEIDATAPGASQPATRDETRALLAQVAPRPDAPLPALVGAGLARKLHVHEGDTFTVLSQDLDGAQVDVDIHVVGLLHTSSEALDWTRVEQYATEARHAGQRPAPRIAVMYCG